MVASLTIASSLVLPNVASVLRHALPRTPDPALLIATAGLCLIALELNRPGLILPGALGLLLVLLAAATLLQYGLRPSALGLLGASAGVFATNLRFRIPGWLLAISILALIAGLRFLLAARAATQVHTAAALGCGTGLGLLAALLSRIAHRAHRAKAVN